MSKGAGGRGPLQKHRYVDWQYTIVFHYAERKVPVMENCVFSASLPDVLVIQFLPQTNPKSVHCSKSSQWAQAMLQAEKQWAARG